jgi:hypothetical protein
MLDQLRDQIPAQFRFTQQAFHPRNAGKGSSVSLFLQQQLMATVSWKLPSPTFNFKPQVVSFDSLQQQYPRTKKLQPCADK